MIANDMRGEFILQPCYAYCSVMGNECIRQFTQQIEVRAEFYSIRSSVTVGSVSN